MSIALADVAPNGAKIQQNATSQQQKSQLPNPFELEDYLILDKIYLTHVNGDEKYDKALSRLVSNIISSSAQISGTSHVLNTQISFKPDFPALKRISCQMITTRGTAECVHQTTMWILQHLRGFSWDAKALITLAAFSLDYGEFMHLNRIQPSDTLGNTLKQLNQVQSRKDPSDIKEHVTFLLEVLHPLEQWATWSAMGYNLEEVHSLSEAMQQIPLVVYWTIATIVACSGNLVSISGHILSNYKNRLSVVVMSLKDHMQNCELEIGRIEDYNKRLEQSKNSKCVVAFLKLLIEGNGSDQKPLIYEGKNKVGTGLEVFKQKYVLLLISGLENLGDEISLLNSIYNRLQDNPQEKEKGIKKEDFKILWIPIVKRWDQDTKNLFRSCKERMKWYVLEYFSELPGLGIIENKLKYVDESIMSLISPEGKIENEKARGLIFEWGFGAFPFRKEDGEYFVKRWDWFWKLMSKVDIKIEDKNRDNYIFIYGGNDQKWIHEFTIAIGSIKKHQTIKDVDINIDYHQLGKHNPKKVSYFWIGVDGMKQNKKCHDSVDCEIQQAVQNLLCLKQDPSGWVLLTKGHHITVFGHAQPMYETVADFEKWKNNVVEKETFDLAFKEYYDTKINEIKMSSSACAVNSSDVLATITCPNPTCGRVMEVTSVNYKCCHRDDQNSCCI